MGNNAQVDLLEECEDKHILSDNHSPVILLKIVRCLSRDVCDQIEGRTDMLIFPVTGVRISEAFKAKPKRITHQALISFQAAGQTQTVRVRIPDATYTHQPALGESLALFISSTWMPAGSLALCTLVKQGSDEKKFNKVLDDSNVSGSLRERLDTLIETKQTSFFREALTSGRIRTLY
ncbi:hypothetical protein CBL_06368 [Carabus blaptoides fortunei]